MFLLLNILDRYIPLYTYIIFIEFCYSIHYTEYSIRLHIMHVVYYLILLYGVIQACI